MGEGIIIIAIDSRAYIVEKGHNNNDLKAIEIAIEKHKKWVKEQNEFYQKNNIRDVNDDPIFFDETVKKINVFDGIEI